MQAERTDMNTIDKFNSHIMGSYGRLNVVLDKGEDDKAVDENGKTYIDFGSGIGTNSLGYCNKEWADAVCEQVRSIQHTSNYYYTKVQAEFAEEIIGSGRNEEICSFATAVPRQTNALSR